MIIQDYKDKLNQAKGVLNSLKENIEKSKKEIKEKEIFLNNVELSQSFIQEIAKQTQEKLKYHIEDIVQLALDACFPEEYEFQVKFEIKRGQTEASLLFLKDEDSINPIHSSGGGAVDVAAFALRIAVWSLGKTSPVLLLDEPFRFLSRDLHERAGKILKSLSDKLGLQIIMVTHNKEMAERISDKIFQVFKKENISEIKDIEKT